MKQLFADSHYFLALFNSRDQSHHSTIEYSSRDYFVLVTTVLVVTEIASSLAATHRRGTISQLVRKLRDDPKNILVPLSDELFTRGVELYSERADKEWSLVDCVSFIVMEQQGITEALTADHHFEQAGFVALLK